MVKENIETILTEFQEHVEWYEIDYYGYNQSSRKRGERKRWKNKWRDNDQKCSNLEEKKSFIGPGGSGNHKEIT